jgi:RNA binding exosome subunit
MAKVPQSVEYVKAVFEAEDIEKVWKYLEMTFSFNIKSWKKEFEAERSHFPRNTTDQEAFMIFGKHQIEPVLNEILKRKKYPTWIGLLTFILKDKIEKRKQRDAYYKTRYE